MSMPAAVQRPIRSLFFLFNFMVSSYFLSSGDRISAIRIARHVFAARDAPNLDAQNQNGLVPAPSRKI